MEEREFDSINVIPLVDIMLVLLTIVLVTATFISLRAIPVKLPETKHTKELPEKRALEFTITKEGKIIYQTREFTLTEVEDLFKALSEDTPIIINIDKTSEVQNLVSLLDILKKYHLKKISIKTFQR